MRVLIVGNGGREHALAWKIRQSPLVGPLYATRPNAGMRPFVIDAGAGPDEIGRIADFAADGGIDLVVVGPEAPLAAGLADRLREREVPVVGPGRSAARLESSKAFAKAMMDELGIPTAAHRTFDDLDAALAYVRALPHPTVIKASGLAAGKGVVVSPDLAVSEATLLAMMAERRFGDAGQTVVIEDLLRGEEVSLIALCSGTDVLPMATSQDHKRLLDGDEGPNTGGMGAYSPALVLDAAAVERAIDAAIRPVLRAFAERGEPYRGFLYAGLMVGADGPKVLEYNVRLGDPEAQALLPRLDCDLVPALVLAARGEALGGVEWRWDPRPCVTVVATSEGYPERPAMGRAVQGLGAEPGASVIFHAATSDDGEGRVTTSGGRVLATSALGATYGDAARAAYEGLADVHFEGMHYRRDIAHRALAREAR